MDRIKGKERAVEPSVHHRSYLGTFYISLCLSSAMPRAAVNEDDFKDKEEELIKELDKPETLKAFVEACKEIGQKAVTVDNDFILIKDGFDVLVKKHGKEFPKVESEFVPRWKALMGVREYFLPVALNHSGAL